MSWSDAHCLQMFPVFNKVTSLISFVLVSKKKLKNNENIYEYNSGKCSSVSAAPDQGLGLISVSFCRR